MNFSPPLLLLLALISFSPESGLWRLSVPEDPEVVFYLFMNGESEPSLYDSAWRPRYLDEVKRNGNKVYLRTIPTSNLQMFEFEIELSEATTLGSLKSRVMQYEVEKSVRAELLTSHLPELPEQAMAPIREGGPEVLVRRIFREASGRSYEEFQKRWDEQVYPDYYVVLEPFYFSTGIDTDNESEYVMKVYEQVKEWNTSSCLPTADWRMGPLREEEPPDPSGELQVRIPSALAK